MDNHFVASPEAQRQSQVFSHRCVPILEVQGWPNGEGQDDGRHDYRKEAKARGRHEAVIQKSQAKNCSPGIRQGGLSVIQTVRAVTELGWLCAAGSGRGGRRLRPLHPAAAPAVGREGPATKADALTTDLPYASHGANVISSALHSTPRGRAVSMPFLQAS